MTTLGNELKRVGLIADLDKFEEQLMEDDTEMTPIQRRLILRKLLKAEGQKEKVTHES
jgi:hypothetical protein